MLVKEKVKPFFYCEPTSVMGIFLRVMLQMECAWCGQLLLSVWPGKTNSSRQTFHLGLSEQLQRKITLIGEYRHCRMGKRQPRLE